LISAIIQYNFQQFPLKEFAVTEFQLIFVQNDLEEVRKLLSLGAEANTQDYSGWTPLHEAAQVTFFRLKEKIAFSKIDISSFTIIAKNVSHLFFF
jgi:hypothetical protein